MGVAWTSRGYNTVTIAAGLKAASFWSGDQDVSGFVLKPQT